MSQVQRTANHCDVCGHEWLPNPMMALTTNYTHCTSGKCRSRRWNQSSVNSQGAAHRKGGEITTGSTKGSAAQPDRAPAVGRKVDGSIPSLPIKPNMQDLRDICAGRIVREIDLGMTQVPGEVAEVEIPTESKIQDMEKAYWRSIRDQAPKGIEVPICGKTWWEDGEQYECLMDAGLHAKHGLRGMVRRLDQ